MKTKVLLFLLMLFLSSVFCLQQINANNIRIYDETRAGDRTKTGVPKLLNKTHDVNVPDNYYAIEFNLMWDNSWKSSNPRNWDAAWIFVKYNLGGTGWKHVWLADTTSGNPKHGVASTGFAKGAVSGQKLGNFTDLEYTITPGYSYVPEAGKSVPVGIFLHRSKNGFGTIQFEKLRLFWNYTDQGLASDDPVTVSVFALEMVYVPSGEFRLGTGGDEYNGFRVSYYTPVATPDNGEAFIMRREDSTCLVQYPTSAGWIPGPDSAYISFKAFSTTIANIQNQTSVSRIPIPKAFPKGVDAYYVMKYEITQEAYVGYLNTLNIQQQGARSKGSALVASDIGTQLGVYDKATYRNGITLYNLSGAGTFVNNLLGAGITPEDVNQSDDGQNIAMNYLRIRDWLSYLAWAGLRPLTEFEFEKACRGNQMPVKNEYAWGNTTANTCLAPTNATGVTRPGFDNEKPVEKTAGLRPNVNFNTTPIRVGSFADSATSRAEAGASYWGIMELTGNVGERYITAQRTTTTLVFKGIHGYGDIDPITADVPPNLSWPIGTDTYDYIWRGGGCGLSYTNEISGRYYPQNTSASTDGSYQNGGRGGRTANTIK